MNVTVARNATTVSLNSSGSSSQQGQSVTFTAAVQPASATGTVALLDGATALCGNVPLSGGTATCTAAFTTPGAHVVVASYSGSGAFNSSRSGAITITVNDSRKQTVATIGGFIGKRNDAILTNSPDENRMVDRLVEASGNAAGGTPGTGFAGSGAAVGGGIETASRLAVGPDGSDLTRMRLGGRQTSTDGNPFPQSSIQNPDGSQTNSGLAGITGPMRAAGSTDGPTRFSFSTSLREINHFNADAEQRKQLAAKAEGGLGLTASGEASKRPPAPTFDVWVEGKYTVSGSAAPR